MGVGRASAAGAALLGALLVGRWLVSQRSIQPLAAQPAASAPPAARAGDSGELREPEAAAGERSAAPLPDEPRADDPASIEARLRDALQAHLALPEIQESDLPPDPPETGPARLTLRLIDARGGESLASRVELWRVDAPQNDDWSAGDQLQATVEVPLDGARIADLPEGRYRAGCARAAASRELPEFEVRAPHTSVELQVELPQELELRVSFVDRFGEPYASVEWWEQSMRLVEPPSAARTQRTPRGARGPSDLHFMLWSSSFAFGFDRPTRVQQAAQSEDGILLGRHRASTRENGLLPVLRLRAPDGALAEVEVPEHGEGVVRLVVVGLPADLAASRVRLPDGRASAAVVETLGLAQPCTDPEREWAAAPVRLKAELEGFASVELEWRASDGELPWILLETVE